jgi:two-component SAPR family response regulator
LASWLSEFQSYNDFVLIDIVMPNKDGLELYERLKNIDPYIKACFLTAGEMYHEEFRKVGHCSLNEDLFLQKPISTDDLIMEINKKINSIYVALFHFSTFQIGLL